MKFEVIGWSEYDNKQYETFSAEKQEEYFAARLAVIEDIRKNGYVFCGDAHLYGYFLEDPSAPYDPEMLAQRTEEGRAPVLNNGKMFRLSMEDWSALMAEAWNTPNDDGIAYMAWYIEGFQDEERPEALKKNKYPRNYVDTSKLLPAGTNFEMVVPDGYAPYLALSKKNLISFIKDKIVRRSGYKIKPDVVAMTLNEKPFRQIDRGTKTVEVRLCDEKRQKLKIGDVVVFFLENHAEHYIPVELIALHSFATFKELFFAGFLSQAGFGGYTPEEAAKKMYAYYDPASEEKNGVLAIEFKVLKEI